MADEKPRTGAPDDLIRTLFTIEISGRRREVTKYADDLRVLIEGDKLVLDMGYTMRRNAPTCILHEISVDERSM